MTVTRKLWAVELRRLGKPIHICGTVYNYDHTYRPHLDEPSRTLLFCTRQIARDWCSRRNAIQQGEGFHFVPVRVTETVKKV